MEVAMWMVEITGRLRPLAQFMSHVQRFVFKFLTLISVSPLKFTMQVALLVGAAATLRFLQHNLCARIRIFKDSEVDLKSAQRPVELTGTVLQIEFTQQLIDSVLAEVGHN